MWLTSHLVQGAGAVGPREAGTEPLKIYPAGWTTAFRPQRLSDLQLRSGLRQRDHRRAEDDAVATNQTLDLLLLQQRPAVPPIQTGPGTLVPDPRLPRLPRQPQQLQHR